MKYTAGELRKMNWRKCKLQYEDKPEAEWEIYVKDLYVSFVTNNNHYNWWWIKKRWYDYSRVLCRDVEDIYTADKSQCNVYYDWRHCIKYKEPEKKLRELMLTDEEYEEVKNKYK